MFDFRGSGHSRHLRQKGEEFARDENMPTAILLLTKHEPRVPGDGHSKNPSDRTLNS
jgi:hypothetical protein